ncbi:Transcription factor spt20 [Tulasnella sp. 403]|nr:Transcription factor spt20 [Tulasnella sp. 403]
MTVYNPTRFYEQLLSQYAHCPPSFTVNFYQEHWLINNSRPNLYHTPISFLLDNIRERRIPPDWLQSFDQHGVTFYDGVFNSSFIIRKLTFTAGCLIIELVDHRTSSSEEPATRERVVLPLDAESLWTDIRLEQEKSGKLPTDEEALDLEARILAATSPPLCLEPDLLVSRIANAALRSSSLPAPTPFRKKDVAAENERDTAIKSRSARIMSLMNPHKAQSTHPSTRLLEIIQRKQAEAAGHQSAHNPDPHPVPITAQAGQSQASAPQPSSGPVPAAASQTKESKRIKQRRPDDVATPTTPTEPTELDPAQSGKIKRKASLTAPTSQPLPKKKVQKREGTSIEPSPAPGQVPLPVVHAQLHQPQQTQHVPPQPQPQPQSHPQPQPQPQSIPASVAYQLTPSTSTAIQYMKRPAIAPPKKAVAPTKKATLDHQVSGKTVPQPPPQPQVVPQAAMMTPQMTPRLMTTQPPTPQTIPLQPPANPPRSKPSTPRPPSVPLQHPQHQAQQQPQSQPQQTTPSQQTSTTQFGQQVANAAAMQGHPSALATFQQQQQQQAVASPRPLAQATVAHNTVPVQFPQGQFTFQAPNAQTMQTMQNIQNIQNLQNAQNMMHLGAYNRFQQGQGGRIPNNQMALMAQMGQANLLQQQQQQHAQQAQQAQLLAAGMIPAQVQTPYQQSQHAASPQIQSRSPHPGAAQVPSRPSSTLSHHPTTPAQNQAQVQAQMHPGGVQSNTVYQALLRRQQLQQQQQQQQLHPQQQFNIQMMQNAPFQLQLAMNAAGQAVNPALGVGAQGMAGWRMAPNQQAMMAQQQQLQQQQMNPLGTFQNMAGMGRGMPGPANAR